jgi:hypothetical protein
MQLPWIRHGWTIAFCSATATYQTSSPTYRCQCNTGKHYQHILRRQMTNTKGNAEISFFIYLIGYLTTLSESRLYAMINECGTVGGMRIGWENRNAGRKPALMPHCSSRIPRDLGSNLGHSGGKPSTNCLSYGMARRNKQS